MNFRKLIKKLLISKIDTNKYQECNPDVKKNIFHHYEHYGFEEGRRAYFSILGNNKSELLPALEIQHLRAKDLPTVSIVPEIFNGTPSPCSYIRLILPLQYLEFLNEINIEDDVSSSRKIWALNRVPNFPVGMVEWIDSIMPSDLILYDLDDDLISHYGKSSAQTKFIILMLILADRVTVSTKALYKIVEKFNKKSEIRRNFSLLNPTANNSNFNREFSILYMGTPTHSEDFQHINEALEVVAEKYKEIMVDLLGVNSISKNKIFNNTNIINSYYPEFMENYGKINTYKIGIIPLVDNLINQSKSNIKYYDYLNKCQYIISSDIGEYKKIKLERLSVVKGNSKDAWIKEIERVINLPLIDNLEIKTSYDDARAVKFNELKKLSNIINSMKLLNNYKVVNHSEVREYLNEIDLYDFFLKRYSVKNGVKLSNLEGKPIELNLAEVIRDNDSLFIEDLLYLNMPLISIIEKIKETNKDFVLTIQFFNYKFKSFSKNKDDLDEANSIAYQKKIPIFVNRNLEKSSLISIESKAYKENLKYINSLGERNPFKSFTKICFDDFDLIIILF
jgi:hypothetical protein